MIGLLQKIESYVKRDTDKKNYLDKFSIIEQMGIERIDYSVSENYGTNKIGEKKYYLYNENYIPFIPYNPPVNGYDDWDYKYYSKYNLQDEVISTINFAKITNMDDILLQMTKIMDASLGSHIALDTLNGFYLKLVDPIEPNYKGRAELVMVDNNLPKDIRPMRLVQYREANIFLDRFIGWNFGINVNRNEKLKKELNNLSVKLIKKGKREDLRMGAYNFVIDGKVEHYMFPVDRYELRGKVKECSIPFDLC